jgi:serpin B
VTFAGEITTSVTNRQTIGLWNQPKTPSRRMIMRFTVFSICSPLMMLAAMGLPAAESLAENLNPPPLKLAWGPSLIGDGPIEFLPWNPATPVGEPPILPPHTRATLSDDANSVVEGNNRFALDIFQQIGSATPDKNLLVSPFSISTALAMTHAGARGNTARQMADTLGFALPDDRLHPAFGELIRDLSEERDGYEFNIANRLFGQADYPFKQPFLNITDRDYGAPLEPLDYASDPEAARVRINDWVEDQTNQKIRELLPEGILNKTTRLVLTNAIHFDGSWKHKFDEKLTREESFFSGGGESQVPMMRQLQNFPYAELPGVQLLEMPYAGDDLSLVAILPTEQDGLARMEATLTPEMLDAGLNALRETQVNVTFPRFTFDSSFKLSDTLKAMGMTDAFDPDFADLTGIANPMDERLLISDVVHKAFIDVNEEGTEAAAATAVIIGALSRCVCPPPLPKEFRADHPFLFALRDRHSGSLIFLGRVVDPGGTASSLNTVPEPSAAWLIVVAVASVMLRRR